MKRLVTPLLSAVLAAGLFTALLLIPFYNSLDSRLYDLLLRLKPAIEEDESIRHLVIDDRSIALVDKYPLPRDIFADGLVLMKEFAPDWTILDIEFIDRSEDGIDQTYLNAGIVDDINRSFDDINFFQRQLVEGILNGDYSRQEARSFLDELENSNWDIANQVYQNVGNSVYSRDLRLARAVGYVDEITATVNLLLDEPNTDFEDAAISETLERKARAVAIARELFAIDDYLTIEHDFFADRPEDGKAIGIDPSLDTVLEASAWGGFPLMHIDHDGVRRRIDVMYRDESTGEYYTHMGFGTWWLRQGKPPITLQRNGMLVGDTYIPLDADGRMLINWPKRLFDGRMINGDVPEGMNRDNPPHLFSFTLLYNHDVLMEYLTEDIRWLEYYGAFSDVYGVTSQPLGAFIEDLDAYRLSMLDTGDGSQAAELGLYRDQFLQEARDFLGGDGEYLILRDLEDVLLEEGITDDNKIFYNEALQALPGLFSQARTTVDDLIALRTELRSKVEGSTIVVGYTGTSTTDYGANPFEKQYMNMGIYGAVYNSLIQGEFLAVAPTWFVVLPAILGAALIMALLSQVAVNRSGLNISINLVFMFLVIAAFGVVFIFTGYYLNLLPVILGLLTTLIVTQSYNFREASQKRASIENSMGKVISPDLVDQIVKDPALLNTTGETRRLTMMFTDIKGFSSISENMSPEQLIELLKRYLTPMSDIILEEKGTIDKYEGDAIIAFWNAPLDQPDHEHRACRAAMRMVKAEKELNRKLVEEGIIEEPLFTRIGINTGLCNVGFIGSDDRRDYTALGDEMNLASRLEGVNKAYGTQVLISEETEKAIHSYFITRRLDVVNVVGKKQPVTLFELSYFKKFPEHYYQEDIDSTELGLKDYYAEVDQNLYLNDFSEIERECFNTYREARTAFFPGREWAKAEALFQQILEKVPGDGPSGVFVDRCKRYTKRPPKKDWDGVYKLESK